MGMMGRMERADIRRRRQRGRRAWAAAGKLFTASFPLYGYLFSDSTRVAYIVDPETSWVVVYIFEQVAAGVPLKRLCRELEARGTPTPGQVLASRGHLPTGKPASGVWRKDTLLRFLHHPAYWGAHSAYRWRSTVEKVRPVETGVTHKRRTKQERDSDDPARIRLPGAREPGVGRACPCAACHHQSGERRAQSGPAGHDLARDGALWALRRAATYP